MTLNDIPELRLQNQQILNPKFKNPADLVKYLGAIQSQDFMGAKWAIGLRTPGSTEEQIDKLFSEGKILRTHALRPTWHFIGPEDVKWITGLNAPQVKRIMNYYNKVLNLDEKLFAKANSIIANALKNKNFLTRTELAKRLEENGIKASGQKLGHIVGWAELDLIICSGPKKGKQFTYALIDDVAPSAKIFSREESIKKLTEIFFKTRGPATIKDFSKWSGLSMTDCKNGIEENDFKSEVVDGKEYYFSKDLQPTTQTKQPLLLPNYDEYISSYADYSIISEPDHRKNLDKIGNASFWNHIVIRGMVVGSWKRTFGKESVEVILAPFRNLSKEEKEGLEHEAEKFAKFYNLKLELSTL